MGFENKKTVYCDPRKRIFRKNKVDEERGKNFLFLIYIEPHNHISRDTLSRWINMVLELAGVDVTKFSAHSTRAASTAVAFSRDVPLDTIIVLY